jgi:inosose dehydratase
MSVRIGVSPNGWTPDDLPGFGEDIPLEVFLREASECGYEGVELGRKFPRTATSLRPLLAGYDLQLVSGWYGARLLERSAAEEIGAMAPHLELLASLGAEVMVFAEVTDCTYTNRRAPLSSRPRLMDEDWKRLGERMTEVATYAETQGLQIAYHHHVGTVVERADDIHRLMAHTGPSVRLLVDTGHLYHAGVDPLSIVRRYADRVAHVHCKDVRVDVLAANQRRDGSFLDGVIEGVFTVPGDGCIDFAAVWALLREAGYSGWLVVEAEQDPARAHPLTYATKGLYHLRDVLYGSSAATLPTGRTARRGTA